MFYHAPCMTWNLRNAVKTRNESKTCAAPAAVIVILYGMASDVFPPLEHRANVTLLYEGKTHGNRKERHKLSGGCRGLLSGHRRLHESLPSVRQQLQLLWSGPLVGVLFQPLADLLAQQADEAPPPDPASPAAAASGESCTVCVFGGRAGRHRQKPAPTGSLPHCSGVPFACGHLAT